MKKFMVLYMASGADFEKMMKNSTPEQQKKGMDAWMKWMNANKTSIVDGGAPLGKTKRVDSNGSSNTKNEIGGYSVVQAESHDAATKIFDKKRSASLSRSNLAARRRGDRINGSMSAFDLSSLPPYPASRMRCQRQPSAFPLASRSRRAASVAQEAAGSP